MEKKLNNTYAIYDTDNDMYYIGSTGQETQQMFNRYIKQKAKIWNIKNYKIIVLKTFKFRLEALEYEVKIQKANDVANSNRYYNTQIDRIVDYIQIGIKSSLSLKKFYNTVPGKKVAKEKGIKSGKSLKGTRASQETKDLMSTQRKGHVVTQETRDKIGLGNKGKLIGHKRSKASRQKQSRTNKGHEVTRETRDKIGDANRGRKHSSEYKENCRLNSSGRIPNTETRSKMSTSQKGRKWYNNGIEHTKVFPGAEPPGWILGMLKL